MSREVINVGAAPNDGQGDPIRTSFIKCNNNFGELYARAQENPPATLVGTIGDVAGMYAYDSTYFYYCYQDYDGSSVIWAKITNDALFSVSQIINGTSDIDIPTANGNITVSVANVPNVAVFSSGGANFTSITANGAVINGDLTVTGNANLSGNIVGDRITNGTTSIEIPAANGNATVSVAGVANVAVFTNTGLAAGSLTATGNVVANSVVLPVNGKIIGYFSPLGEAGRTLFQTSNTDTNATTFVSAAPGANNTNAIRSAFTCYQSNDYANSQVLGIYAYATESRLHSRAFGTANVNPLTIYVGTTNAAFFDLSGNCGLGNSTPDDRLSVQGNAYISGNVSAGNLVGAVTASVLNVNGLSTFSGNLVPSANITYDLGNSTNRWNDIWLANSTVYLGDAEMQANASALILTSPSGGEVTVTGSAGSGSLNADLITASGNVTGANLTTAGAVSASGTVTGGNITTSGGMTATGNIFTNGIFIGDGSGLTGVVAVGNVGAASQFTNGSTSLNIPVAGGNIIGNISGSVNLFEFSTIGLSAAGNVTANNISAANLVTASQISVSGNITSSGIFVGDGSGLANVTANVGSASQLTSGTTEINIPVANGNIVANVAGSTNLFQWSTVGFSAQGNITGGNIVTAGNLSATNIIGTLVTAAQTNITSVGTLTSLNSGVISSSGNVTGANLRTGGVVSATGNITGGNLSGTNVSGTLTTAAQTNITSVGTLSSLSVSGNITGGNLSVNTGVVSVGSIVNNNANGVGNIGTTGTRFNTVFALASSAQYADLAERYLADQSYAPGTVVAFGGSQEITRCDQDHDVTVAGIVSDRPAYEMNAGLVGDHPLAVALAGRVPCQVTGPIRRGQMLVSAGDGRARAESSPLMGAVIGKALEDFDGTTGTIEVVVGRI